MTIIYHTLRIAEIIVIMVTAVRLLTCPYEMRWKGVVAKVLFGTFWITGTVLLIVNSFFYKYSGVEYIMMAGYTLIILVIFFKVSLLHEMMNSVTFWMILMNMHYLETVLSTEIMNVECLEQYNKDFTIICPLEFVKSIVIIGLLVVLYRRQKPMFPIENRRVYILVTLFGILEWWWMDYVFTPLNEKKISEGMSQFAVWLGIMTILSCIFLMVYNAYVVERQQLKLMYLKDRMLEEQFGSLKENYELKRRQVHDSMQQNLLLSGYLEQGKVEEAQKYLLELRNGLTATQIKGETGIIEIDVMLHYKRQQAELQNTRIYTAIEVYFCPLKQNDICILLGNLLDNALEATAQLPEEQREIKLYLRTINHMLLLSVENQYQGKRRIQEGKYLTTKKETWEHGLGLESSRRIVESYGGSFQIKDDGSTFCIETIIFKQKGEEENEKQSGTESMESGGKLAAGTQGN